MVKDIIYILLGFIFLIYGADILVKGSRNIAKKFKIPDVIIGLTIVGIGTSMPEFIITINSALKGYTELLVSNMIGSNICNMLLILGLTSIIREVKLNKEMIYIHLPVAIIFTLMIYIFMTIGTSSRIYGYILLTLFLIYFSYPIIQAIKDIVITEKKEQNKKKKCNKKGNNILLSTFYITVGIILLKYGGDFVVDSSVSIAKIFGLSEKVIGFTIISIGTSLPELVTSIVAAVKKDESLAIGNLIGSCIINFGLILAVGNIIKPLVYSVSLKLSLAIFSIYLFEILVATYKNKEHKLTRKNGVFLVISFCIYITVLVIKG